MLDLPIATWITLAGLLGLLIGSFLNVVILRLPARMQAAWEREARQVLTLPDEDRPLPPGIVREPSHCMHCGHPLAPWDNIPLVSWILLRGRCRYCGTRISAQYPLVELLCGVLSAVVVWKFGAHVATLAPLVLTWTLIAAAGIDVRTQLLPDQLTLPLLWLGLLVSLLPGAVGPGAAILGAAIGYLALWCVYWAFKLLTGKEGMGYGDFKLLAALGAWFGPLGLLPVIIISSFVGMLVGGGMIFLRRHDAAIPIPFGPFLAAAGWIWLVAGDALLRTYLRVSGMA